MEYIGEHLKRKVYYVNYQKLVIDEMPYSDWICFAMSNEKPDDTKLTEFVQNVLKKDVLEFIGYGIYGEYLHNFFDNEMVLMSINGHYPEIDIVTTWNIDNLAEAFWECFGATCLPDRANYEDLKIICVDFDNLNYSTKLKDLINRFNENWLP